MPRDGAKTLNGAAATRNEAATSPKEKQPKEKQPEEKQPNEKQNASKEPDSSLKDGGKPSREAENAARAFRLGLFVVGSLAVLAIGVFLIGNREMLFSSTYTLKSNFETVAGLIEGADVRVGGMHEGTVKHIE